MVNIRSTEVAEAYNRFRAATAKSNAAQAADYIRSLSADERNLVTVARGRFPDRKLDSALERIRG